MRVANVRGRLALVGPDGAAADVAVASDGRFGPDPQGIYEHWADFVAWAGATRDLPWSPVDPADLGSPAPYPGQVFAVGLNYGRHVEESIYSRPTEPTIFTKWPSCITGPFRTLRLPADGTSDWEVELVVVLGRSVRDVAAADAWDYVAGVCVGQDLSERGMQRRGPAPQFSLAKSLDGFGPMGPHLVTVDELDDPDDLELGCSLNGTTVQSGRTSQMIHPVRELISYLSSHVTLRPGDVIFSGTPDGVGVARTPPQFLAPDDELVSWIGGVGTMRHRFTA